MRSECLGSIFGGFIMISNSQQIEVLGLQSTHLCWSRTPESLRITPNDVAVFRCGPCSDRPKHKSVACIPLYSHDIPHVIMFFGLYHFITHSFVAQIRRQIYPDSCWWSSGTWLSTTGTETSHEVTKLSWLGIAWNAFSVINHDDDDDDDDDDDGCGWSWSWSWWWWWWWWWWWLLEEVWSYRQRQVKICFSFLCLFLF